MIFKDISAAVVLRTEPICTMMGITATEIVNISAILELHNKKFSSLSLLYDEETFIELYDDILMTSITDINNSIKQHILSNANLTTLDDYVIKNTATFTNTQEASTGYDATNIASSFSGSKGSAGGDNTIINTDTLSYLYKLNEKFSVIFDEYDFKMYEILQTLYGAN